ncbi:Inner membrane protein YghB [Edwardsiella tarda]|nr:Inner membrane protein YghB [Edwardsiella tarda]
MEVIKEILHALWAQDFAVLSDPHVVWIIYAILFTTLGLREWFASRRLSTG